MMFNSYVPLGFLASSVEPYAVDLSTCFPFSFNVMALSHYFLNMALLCFLEWETEMVPMVVGEAGFEILLPDNMAAQREIWAVQSLGIPGCGCEHPVGSYGLRTPQRAGTHASKTRGGLSELDRPSLAIS